MAFLAFPNEIIQHIAILCADRELCNLSAACRDLRQIIFSDLSGIWRQRFEQEFDKPSTKINYKQEYIARFSAVPYVDASRTPIPIPVDALVLNRVAMESRFSGIGRTSNNMRYIARVLEEAQILERTLDANWPFHPRRSYENFQLLFFHQTVDVFNEHCYNNFETAQQVAYGNPDTHPLFKYESPKSLPHPRLNAFLSLSMFFKAHYTELPDARSFFDALAPIDRPQPWTCRLDLAQKSLNPLGVNWHGSSVSLLEPHEISLVRKRRNCPGSVLDRFEALDDLDDSDGFDDLVLSFEPEHQPKSWPSNVLRSLSLLRSTQRSSVPSALTTGSSAIRSPRISFVGNARMLRDFLVAGFLEPTGNLKGRSGWKRIVFVLYNDPDPDTSSNYDLFGILARKGKVPLGKDPSAKERDFETERYSRNPATVKPRPFDQHMFPECIGYDGSGVSQKGRRCYLPLPDAVAKRNDKSRENYRSIVSRAVDPPDQEEREWWKNTEYRTPNLAVDLTPFDLLNGAYAFEGLVWPGGNVMMGRWWNLAEDEWDSEAQDWSKRGEDWRQDTGPWCFWCTDLGYEWEGDDSDGGDGDGDTVMSE